MPFSLRTCAEYATLAPILPDRLCKCRSTLPAPDNIITKRNVCKRSGICCEQFTRRCPGDLLCIAVNAKCFFRRWTLIQKYRWDTGEHLRTQCPRRAASLNNHTGRRPERQQRLDIKSHLVSVAPFTILGRFCVRHHLNAPLRRLRVAAEAIKLRGIALRHARLEIEDGSQRPVQVSGYTSGASHRKPSCRR